MVRDIRQLLEDVHVHNFCHIFCEVNSIADALTNDRYKIDHTFIRFCNLPPLLIKLCIIFGILGSQQEPQCDFILFSMENVI